MRHRMIVVGVVMAIACIAPAGTSVADSPNQGAKAGSQGSQSTGTTVNKPTGTVPKVAEPTTAGTIRGRNAVPGGAAAKPCITDPSQISGQRTTRVGHVTAGVRIPSPPPKPKQTNAPTPPATGLVTVQPQHALTGDLSPQLCESLKSGVVTGEEVTAIFQTMEKEHAGKTHTLRKQVHAGPVSYTYEYAFHVGGLRFYQRPGVGYCSDFDWRFLVRNVSQQNVTLLSTTGEIGVCFSPGFGLFFVPGLATAMSFPIPGLCFDDAALTKLDLRNVSDKFEGELLHLVNLAFAKLRRADAKLCIIGVGVPPWFAPAIVPPSNMVAYCTSTRQCEFDAAKLAQAAAGSR